MSDVTKQNEASSRYNDLLTQRRGMDHICEDHDATYTRRRFISSPPHRFIDRLFASLLIFCINDLESK
jgi:hypothetical protein